MNIQDANKELRQKGLPVAFRTNSQPRRTAVNANLDEIQRVCAVMWRHGYQRTELHDGLDTDCQMIFERRNGR